MLTVTAIRGSNSYAAAHYFSAADDYYAKDEHGEWHGKGAESLGLIGGIERAQVARLLAGALPNGEHVPGTFRDDAQRRMGYDLTMQAPKSVSMQALVGGDVRVVEAHDRAVDRTLDMIEKVIESRLKKDGKTAREITGNAIFAKCRHELSRSKDPHLHTHAVLFNMTKRSDGKWRALVNDKLYQMSTQFDAVYKSELARNLRALGYGLRAVGDKGDFELSHISRDQIEMFSSRGLKIEQKLAEQGLTRETATPAEKQKIAMQTRPKKDERNLEKVKASWIDRSVTAGIDYGAPVDRNGVVLNVLSKQGGGKDVPDAENGEEPVTDGLNRPVERLGEGSGAVHPPLAAKTAVRFAVKHLTEREAVVEKGDLIAAAVHRSLGLASYDEIIKEIDKQVQDGALIEAAPGYKIANVPGLPTLTPQGWERYLIEFRGMSQKQSKAHVAKAIYDKTLIPADIRYTTKEGVRRERSILKTSVEERAAVAPVFLKTQELDERLASRTLSDGQREAIKTILSSPDRFVAVLGDAGTGKTFSIKAAAALAEQQGYRMVAIAPYGSQVKALRLEGMEARSLASFLHSKNKKIDARTIVVLDEAAVVGSRQMDLVMQEIKAHGSRMVLLGDPKQTEAIESGKPFVQLMQHGMQTARISEIQRQKDPQLKMAVEAIADAQVEKSLRSLSGVFSFPEKKERWGTIVADYMNLPANEQEKALIVAGTNEARKSINEMVRLEKGLSGAGRAYNTLTRVDMTQAQRQHAPSYRPDMVVVPDKELPALGLTRGEFYTVKEAVSDDVLRVKSRAGASLLINIKDADSLGIYERERSEFAVGDVLRVTRNDSVQGLTNGDLMRVTAVGETLTLQPLHRLQEDAGTAQRTFLAKDMLHLDHAYAATVHTAQGLTSDRVFADINTKSRTTSMNLYYVAISRARDKAFVYTNNVSDLPDVISRRYDKTTALSVFENKGTSKSAIEHHAPLLSRVNIIHEKRQRELRVNERKLSREKSTELQR
jgi:conjugative relaxase-like TrwC/TraI family protein